MVVVLVPSMNSMRGEVRVNQGGFISIPIRISNRPREETIGR
jgi:hypothetical protein